MADRNLQKLADAAASRYGVPRWLFRRLIQQESGWNPDARNPSGATGLVQIHLPSHPDISEEQARDPAFALGWGARYLKAQHDQFGNWNDALAAYNAGPGNVKSGRWKAFPETRNYVNSILGGSKDPGLPKPPTLPLVTAALGTPAPTPSPDLIGSVFASNNALLGVDTPDFVTNLLATLPKPAKLAVAAPIAAAGAPPQEPFHAPANIKGFVPQFKTALDRLIAASGGRVKVTSGYRTPEHQAELYAAALKKYGSEKEARRWVAPPGRSKHGEGVAADLSGDLAWARANAAKFGLHFPLSNEGWHVELIGSRG